MMHQAIQIRNPTHSLVSVVVGKGTRDFPLISRGPVENIATSRASHTSIFLASKHCSRQQ